MSPLIKTTVIAVSLIGLVASILGIIEYQGTTAGNVACIVATAIVVIWLGVCVYLGGRKLVSVSKDWGSVLQLAAKIHALKLAPSQIEYVLDFAARQEPERPAMIDEVRKSIVSAPMLNLLPADVVLKELDQMASELTEEQLLWYRWHREGPYSFQLDFDSFKFVASPPTAKLARLKHGIREDILRRFRGRSLDSAVIVHRGNENYHQTGPLFEELMGLLKCSLPIGFLTDNTRRKDIMWRREFARNCNGKGVLLIDPIMVDCSIDDACEAIQEFKGSVAGALILFEVAGVKPSTLRNYNLLKGCCGASELGGQLVLDLRKI